MACARFWSLEVLWHPASTQIIVTAAAAAAASASTRRTKQDASRDAPHDRIDRP